MSSTVCVECNALLATDTEFCPECGFPVNSLAPVTCPGCNNLVVFSAEGCPVCGEAIPPAVPGLSPEETTMQQVPVTPPEEPFASDPPVPAPVAELVPASADIAKEGDREVVVMVASEAGGLEAVAVTVSDPDVVESGGLDRSQAEQDAISVEDVSSGPVDGNGMVLAALQELQEAHRTLKQDMLDNQQQLFAMMHELESTVLTGMQGAMTTLADAQKTALKEIASAVKPGQSSDTPAQSEPPKGAGDTAEYLFYLALGILVFTILNTLIAAYLVRVVRSGVGG
jgi:RNA polymerase subunit RPABC4/transcription elongation factor Spt4